ncbi:hypothetical protein [Geminocystis sp. NIES-3708]|uniref:hypothetical protein n=1 Tax=Geminocystis sp. NIES-3708 TaxID=1615909 RepID=UPI001E35EDE2|nr:hypothetical protein [Geminocystis sp. NIES-3708]
MGIVFFQQKYVKTNIENKTTQVDYFSQEEKLKTALTLQKKLPTVGFNNLLADWQYLQLIQYFGDTPARDKTGYSLVTDYFELISNYDPSFVNAYFFLSTANSIYAGKPEKTVEFLDKILPQITPEVNPLAFNLWTYKGVDEILFLGDISAAQKSYEKSAQWALTRGDDIGKSVAKQRLETAQYLAKNPDSKKAQVSAWANILTSVFDDKSRQMAMDKIKSLGGEVNISKDGKVQVKLPQED